MSTKSTISINYVDRAGKKGQKSITDINPAASGEQLQEFAEKLNALTTNSYGNTNRVDKTPITDAEEPVDNRTTPTIVCYAKANPYGAAPHATTNDGFDPTISSGQARSGATATSGSVILKTDTDARPYIVSQPENAATVIRIIPNANAPEDAGTWRTDLPYALWVHCCGVQADLVGEYVIGFPATENFKAATYTFTITA